MFLRRFLGWNMILAAVLLTITFYVSISFLGRSSYVPNLHISKPTTDTTDLSHGHTLADPLFDHEYDENITTLPNTKVTKDPCADITLANDGAKAKSGHGVTVLVTGGAGFIGSNLVDRLLELGYKVKILDNLYTGFLRNVPLQNKNVEFIFGDILNKDALKEALDGVEFVYHLAAMSKVVPSLKSPEMARFCTESNALGSWNVLDAVREQGNVKKVIYAASSTYYGNKPAPHREDMAADFLTPYAASKYEGELQMQMFDRLFQVPTISTRFFMVYGPRQPSTGAYAIVTGVFAKQAAQGQQLTIEGDGSHYRDFIHVTDIVEGLILAQQSPDLRGDVVNLGTGTAFSVQEVADLVSKDQVHTDARANDLEGTLADTCKMKRLLNYKAKADFKTEMAYMAKETIEGNVFMQEWLTPLHALSAPHLLSPGTPVFKWPADQSDLQGLLSAYGDIRRRAKVDGKTATELVSVIPFSTAKEDVELIGDLILNTIFSLVHFGGVKTYIVAAYDDDALASCITLNLPCYDVRSKGALALIADLLSQGYDTHFAQLGNSYVHDIDTVLDSLLGKDSQPDIITANQEGDVFILTNDRTKSAIHKWSQSAAMPKDDSRAMFAMDAWQRLDLTKAEYSVRLFCTSDETASSTVSDRDLSERSPLDELSAICQMKLYAAIGCPQSTAPQSANSTINALKAIGAWHLHSCENVEKCDRQQVVPLRWLGRPPNLAAVEKLC
jgi:nucleoside-diphosphate-sugar epimerase